MTFTLDLDIPEVGPTGDGDNITDWCLKQFQSKYDDQVTKDDVWEYVYGVMHAPDWRQGYRHDLQRNLARIPLAEDFEAFRSAGRALMDLHIGYETVQEWPVRLPRGRRARRRTSRRHDAYRIESKMRWGTHRRPRHGSQRAACQQQVPTRRHPPGSARLRHLGPLPAAVGHR